MWAEKNKAVEKLTALNDPCLLKLEYEHRIDPLWSDLKFGDWLELRLAFVEERGYVRGFRQGIKAAQAQLSGVAPAITEKQRLYLYLCVVPVASAILTVLVLMGVRAVQQDSILGVAAVCIVSPAVLALHAIASWGLVRMAINNALGIETEDRVILAKPPVDPDGDVASDKGVEQITNVITRADNNKHGTGSVDED